MRISTQMIYDSGAARMNEMQTALNKTQQQIATGRRIPWKVLFPGDPAGVAHIRDIRLTPDGEGYAYGYGRYLQDLYLVEGLRY